MKIYFGKREDYFDKFWEKVKDDLIPTEEVNTCTDGYKWLKNKLEEINFKSYYYNVNFNTEYNYVEIDFGSHSIFCLFYDLNDKDWDLFSDYVLSDYVN